MAPNKLLKKPTLKSKLSVIEELIKLPGFPKIYVIFALLVTFATTVYWSLLSARIQLGNSDQLVDSQLFHSFKTFHDASFPGAHTFLLKWPIFLLVRLLGSSNTVIDAVTVGLVLLTVGGLIYCLYRIEKRPLVFGTICLALASVLLMIPAAPYAGALLPLNMAMLTTRNIEYLVFILSLVLFIRSRRIKSLGFWLSVACLSLLIASDKLFLIFAIGGALIGLILYARSRSWHIVNVMVNWLIAGVIAAIGAFLILALINGSGLTHLVNQSNANPYGLASGPKQFVLGGIYAVLGLLSNFGANPAYDATTVRNIPHQIVARLFSLGGPAYIINFVLVVIGLFVVYRLIRTTWVTYSHTKKPSLNRASLLSILLIWSSVVAVISFIATSHYYAVDGRYLGIVLFTVFITFAAYSRTRKWQPNMLVGAGLVLVVSIIFGLIGATHSYSDDRNALADQNSDNATAVTVLAQHHANVLVGDYWRVVPIRQASANSIDIMPLSSCTQAQQALSSTAWQPNLKDTGFAYLLTIHGSLTNYPDCSLKQVVSTYGRPNASVLIDGTIANPDQLLLFYDKGINNGPPKHPQPPQGPDTVLPIPISQLSNTTCPVESIVNIVAHQDDDLLFMNPDLLNYIKAGDCVRSIYLTAGDDGQGQFYWLSREEGSEAAYSYMIGTKSIWVQKIVELANHEYVTVANPRGNSKIALIFMHLPDGNLKGQGFPATKYESLAKLAAGHISVINSVDGQSYYTSTQLISALSLLMNTYQPTKINTQASFISQQYPDHSDHLTVNWYVKQAYKQFETQKYANQVVIPIKYYIGYPIHAMPSNVSGPQLLEKEQVFMQYAKYDSHVCQTIPICLQSTAYGAYLTRQYQNPY